MADRNAGPTPACPAFDGDTFLLVLLREPLIKVLVLMILVFLLLLGPTVYGNAGNYAVSTDASLNAACAGDSLCCWE